MSLEDLKTKISERLTRASSLNARIKFDFGDEGVLLADTTQSPPVLMDEDGEAETTLACTPDLLRAILDGSKDPSVAYLMGQLKIRGSLGLAMKLNGFLEG